MWFGCVKYICKLPRYSAKQTHQFDADIQGININVSFSELCTHSFNCNTIILNSLKLPRDHRRPRVAADCCYKCSLWCVALIHDVSCYIKFKAWKWAVSPLFTVLLIHVQTDMKAVSKHARCVLQNVDRTGIAALLSHYRSQFTYEPVCHTNNSGITKPDICHNSLWPATVTIFVSLSAIDTFQRLTVLGLSWGWRQQDSTKQ
jgi:hypothetical protein